MTTREPTGSLKRRHRRRCGLGTLHSTELSSFAYDLEMIAASLEESLCGHSIFFGLPIRPIPSSVAGEGILPAARPLQ